MKYGVYWMEKGEPYSELFSSQEEAERFMCEIRGQEGVEDVDMGEDESEPMEDLFEGMDLSEEEKKELEFLGFRGPDNDDFWGGDDWEY